MKLSKIQFMHVMGVVQLSKKNPFEVGTAEYQIFEDGVAYERARLMKVLERYHDMFCGGPLEKHLDCVKTMEIRYLYDFISESKTLK